VTADTLALRRSGEVSADVPRARFSTEVSEACEKLTSCAASRYGFEIELLRVFARAHRSTSLAMAGIGAVIATIATTWVPLDKVLLWLVLDLAALAATYRFVGTLLAADDSTIDPRRWQRKFIFAETLQGFTWAVIVWLIGQSGDPEARGFILVLLMLVAAMNATISASIPAALIGALMPMTLAVLGSLCWASLSNKTFALIALACGTQIHFMFLARRLHVASLKGLSCQAEKDELIAELEEAKANSDLARHRAEAANLAKSRFLATMSHELRTPLNAILGFSEVMKGELFGSHAIASYKEYSTDIHASGHHLLTLINEILDLSRIEAGRFDLKEEAITLVHIIEECMRLLGLKAKKRRISVEKAVEPDLPQIWGDARAIRQVVLNLLSNAIKFTPEGGLIKIRIGWTSRRGQYVAVRDSGPGIPEDEIPIVMSSFGRGTLAQKNAEEGSGLGLPIVKGLVELHGGTFTLNSELDHGTEVIVIFPPERVVDRCSPAEEKHIGSRSGAHWRESSPAAWEPPRTYELNLGLGLRAREPDKRNSV